MLTQADYIRIAETLADSTDAEWLAELFSIREQRVSRKFSRNKFIGEVHRLIRVRGIQSTCCTDGACDLCQADSAIISSDGHPSASVERKM